MKIKLYTLSHDVNILKEIDNNGGQFTAEEHAYAVKKEYEETTYKTKEQLIDDEKHQTSYPKQPQNRP